MLQDRRARIRFAMTLLNFSIDLILPLWPEDDSSSNRNDYQESSCGKALPTRTADDLTAICEPIYKMWEPLRFTNLRPSTTSDKNSFLFALQE
jgi:hypothetical protein